MKRFLLFLIIFGFWQPIYGVTVSLQQLAAASTIAQNVVPHLFHPKKFTHTVGAELHRVFKKSTKGKGTTK